MSQNGSGKKFDREEYRRRKAQRDQDRPTQWVTNPETGEEFCLRRVGAVGYAISGALPHNLTNEAVTAWKAAGLAVGEEAAVDPKKLAAAQRNVDLIAVLVRDACVVPKIVTGASADDEMDPLEMNDSDILFIFRWATGQIGSLPLKGGEEVKVADLQEFPELPDQLPGTGVSEPELQPATQ